MASPAIKVEPVTTVPASGSSLVEDQIQYLKGFLPSGVANSSDATFASESA